MDWGNEDQTIAPAASRREAPKTGSSWGNSDQNASAPSRAKYRGLSSEGLGFMKGVGKVAANINRVDPLNFNRKATDSYETGMNDYFAKREETEKPGMVGEVAGGIVASLPAMAVTRNPFIGGALQGAMMTDKRDLGGVAMDAGAAAVLNWFGGKAMDAAADVIKPVIDPAVRRLKDAGVRLSPGMIKGTKAMVKEDKAMSRPGVGDDIRAVRMATQETFNTAGVNKALAPLGIKVPSMVKPGQDSIDFAKTEITRAYDLVIPNLAVKINGQQFAQKVYTAGRNLKVPEQQHLMDIVRNELGSGQLQGQALKDAQGEIRRLASDYSRSQLASERNLGKALWAVDDELSSTMIAQNPKFAPDLQKVNTAYRGYKIMSDAASRADDGLINTGQLKQSVRRGDRSKDKDASSRGVAFFQDFSKDARAVIPAQTPNSGTTDRQMSANLFARLGGQLERGAFALDDVYQQSRFIPRPRIAQPAANVVRRLRAPVGAASIAGTQPFRD